jgi:hypothetical protein
MPRGWVFSPARISSIGEIRLLCEFTSDQFIRNMVDLGCRLIKDSTGSIFFVRYIQGSYRTLPLRCGNRNLTNRICPISETVISEI